jgi:hypothetical protein
MLQLVEVQSFHSSIAVAAASMSLETGMVLSHVQDTGVQKGEKHLCTDKFRCHVAPKIELKRSSVKHVLLEPQLWKNLCTVLEEHHV